MLKNIFSTFCVFSLVFGINSIKIDQVLDGTADGQIGESFVAAVKETTKLPSLVTLFLSTDEIDEEITNFAFGTIIGRSEILTSMNFYFLDYVHAWIVYDGKVVEKLDKNFELLYSERYNSSNGWYDALVIKFYDIEFEDDRILQLNGNPDIFDLDNSFTISMNGTQFTHASFQASRECTHLKEIFNPEQQACGAASLPFIDPDNEEWQIFGAPWFCNARDGKTYLVGFNSFFNSPTPKANFFQRTDFLCAKEFVNYKFSCRNFEDSFTENMYKLSEENLEEVLSENSGVVAIFKEVKSLFNWERTFFGVAVAHSSNAILVPATFIDPRELEKMEIYGNIRFMASSSRHEMFELVDIDFTVHPLKDTSLWHNIALISSSSFSFDSDEIVSLNSNPDIMEKGLQTLELISEDELAWTSYDLFTPQHCSISFSDAHCCEYGPEQQICGPNREHLIPGAPLLDNNGILVGIFSAKNPFFHGQHVDVFTRIDANMEWINSFFE